MSLTKDDLAILEMPFDPKTVGVKVQSLSKNKDKALLVLYVQHTDVYNRLESIDPAWSCDMTKIDRITNEKNVIYYVTVRMTLKGVSRENVGDGNDPKGAFSDALKRVAMLFGVGRYLYDQQMVWVPYNESMKFNKWTYEEYSKSLRPEPNKQKQTQPQPVKQQSSPIPNQTVRGPPLVNHAPQSKSTHEPKFEHPVGPMTQQLRDTVKKNNSPKP